MFLQCLQLPNRYKNSKLIAYELLCQMFVRRDNTFLPLDSLTHFYQALHLGLVSQEQVIISLFLQQYENAYNVQCMHDNINDLRGKLGIKDIGCCVQERRLCLLGHGQLHKEVPNSNCGGKLWKG